MGGGLGFSIRHGAGLALNPGDVAFRCVGGGCVGNCDQVSAI